MRLILVVISVAAAASAAFALRELSAMPVVHAPTLRPADAETVVTTRVPSLPLSTARGPLPFGGVPANTITAPIVDPEPEDEENDVSDSDSIPDSIDRCPDEPEDHEGADDDDGCPEAV